eukprot:767734-Hanusia_phi.AAC.6
MGGTCGPLRHTTYLWRENNETVGSPVMRVFLKFEGSKLPIDFSPGSLQNLRTMIHELTGVPAEKQRLVHKKKLIRTTNDVEVVREHEVLLLIGAKLESHDCRISNEWDEKGEGQVLVKSICQVGFNAGNLEVLTISVDVCKMETTGILLSKVIAKARREWRLVRMVILSSPLDLLQTAFSSTQQLLFGGVEVQLGRTLEEHKITPGSSLFLVNRPLPPHFSPS